MTLRGALTTIFLALALLGLPSCAPYSADPQDEEKETYYMAGKKHLQNMDHEGAREMFEKAVEANPRSSAAHFQLGVLNENHFSNYVSAIYHYEKHLKLRPQSDMTEIVRQRIKTCQLELAKAVTLGVASREVTRELDRLNQENANLKKQVETYRLQLAAKPLVITNYVQVPQVPAPDLGAIAENPRREPPPVNTRPSTSLQRAGSPTTTQRPSNRTHIVGRGETFSSIARKYNVSPAALQAANPGVDSRKMKVGATLRIPSR
ncbi:MAG TPA: LysM peptidoglycan-binding domain-containing protein [Methylomirabilota bacterium]|nr:LysM peptidoglycan-binding domain-containing protein [Methylomirabilota bacterium]